MRTGSTSLSARQHPHQRRQPSAPASTARSRVTDARDVGEDQRPGVVKRAKDGARRPDARDDDLWSAVGAVSNVGPNLENAFFSLFRCTHGTGSQEFRSRTYSTETERFGSWMKAWRAAPTKGAVGVRLFDAREFHVGFGIVVPPDERLPNSASRA